MLIGKTLSRGRAIVLLVTALTLTLSFLTLSPRRAPASSSTGESALGQTGSTTWYLAEGSTGFTGEDGFYTTVFVQNPGEVNAEVEITYQTPGGDVPGPDLVVEPQSTGYVEVSATEGLENEWSVSTMVTSDEPVVAGRSMRYWVSNPDPIGEVITRCEHYSIGVVEPRYEWFLAEGSTGTSAPGITPRGNFETWVLVQNPGDSPAEVQLYYQTPQGEVPGQTDILPPNSRRSWNIGQVLPDTWSVSTRVIADRPVIAERSMYWNTPDVYRQCAHDSVGVTVPATDWYLAEGSTGYDSMGFFETWILVQNPSKTTGASAQVEFQTPTGRLAGPTLLLNPGTRESVDVSDWVDGEFSVSTRVVSDEPVVAERSMYWNSWYEGGTAVTYRQSAHDSIGATAPDDTWCLPGGFTFASEVSMYDSWVLVQNPHNYSVTFNITYTTDEGPVTGPSDKLFAKSRKSYRINDDTGYTSTCTGAVVVSDYTLVCENSIYNSTSMTDPSGYRRSAMDSIGFP